MTLDLTVDHMYIGVSYQALSRTLPGSRVVCAGLVETCEPSVILNL